MSLFVQILTPPAEKYPSPPIFFKSGRLGMGKYPLPRIFSVFCGGELFVLGLPGLFLILGPPLGLGDPSPKR